MIIAAIEAGGTKFVCGLFDIGESGATKPALVAKGSIPTTTPGETLAASLAFFEAQVASKGIGRPERLGIGSFGPVDLRPSSPTWGYITATPKAGWRNAEIAGFLKRKMGVPVFFDTDVNAAAFGEYLWGAGRGLSDFIYITVGTGIGGGVFANGHLVHGLGHPELGHVKIQRAKGDDFPGNCPFHGDCLEGMASGPAIGQRWGMRSELLEEGHEAWELEARYLAKAFADYTFVLSPQRILMGGGVGMRPLFAERVALLVGEELGGYIDALRDEKALASYVVRPELGSEAGLYGAAAIAL